MNDPSPLVVVRAPIPILEILVVVGVELIESDIVVKLTESENEGLESENGEEEERVESEEEEGGRELDQGLSSHLLHSP